MAKQIDGSVSLVLTAKITAGSEAAYKKAVAALDEGLIKATSVEVPKGVTVTGAVVEHAQASTLVEAPTDGDAADNDAAEGPEDDPNNDKDGESKKAKKDKGGKADKAKKGKGKSKGRS